MGFYDARGRQYIIVVLILCSVASHTRGESEDLVPSDLPSLLAVLRSTEQLYRSGFRVRYWQYEGAYPKSEIDLLFSENVSDVDVWLNSPRYRLEDRMLFRKRDYTIRLLTLYTSDGTEDRWLSLPLDDDPQTTGLANVGPAGVLESALQLPVDVPAFAQSRFRLQELQRLESKFTFHRVRTIDGIRTLVVEALRGEPPYGGNGQHEEFCFAVDRNYICWRLAIQWWWTWEHDKTWGFATCISEVVDWMEYEPGLWFPAMWRTRAFAPDPSSKQYDFPINKMGRLISVERLDAPLSHEKLQVEFPPGTTVYTLDAEGNIVGREEVAEAEKAVPEWRWNAWLAPVAVALVFLFTAYYLWRRTTAAG